MNLMPITLSDFYKKKFGRKVYKLAVDLGCSCPNRDGTLETRGCIFCSANGSGDFMPPKNLSVPEQLERAKALVQKKAYGRSGPRLFGVEEVSAKEKNSQDQKAPRVFGVEMSLPRSKMSLPDMSLQNAKMSLPRATRQSLAFKNSLQGQKAAPLGQPTIFCNNQNSLQDQKAPLLAAKSALPAPAYIAYFQNFSNTYGGPQILRQKYFAALSVPDIVGVDIATRPDCLGDEIIRVIKELSQKTFVTVELGLQTVRQKTADYIRRGYDTSVYFEAVAALKKNCPAVHIVTQIIFGLPGESDGDMMETVRRAVECGTDGIKITCLYVLAGTDLEKDWRAGKVECLTKERYFELLKKAARLFPPGLVVHRLTGDGPKKILLAPEWTKNKRQVLNELAALHLF